MQLVIPMSGTGTRFLTAGYTVPKPLIEVMGKPMIAWVLSMFPKVSKTIFICREDHLTQTPMRDVLNVLCPEGIIVPIKGHKLGPVYAVAKAFPHIDDQDPVMMSYCDYMMDWNFAKFEQDVLARKSDGAIPCYTGFHPHLLRPENLYASCKRDAHDNLIEIREKFSFEPDKTKAHHSPGAYYIRSGEIAKQYIQKMLDHGEALNGEFYLSLMYNLMVQDQRSIWVPDNVTHFCQWGTPEDLQEWRLWTNLVTKTRES